MMLRWALLAALTVGCGGKKNEEPAPTAKRGPLPTAPLPIDLGQEPIVSTVNLWEMMIEGSPDHETVGFVGDQRVTTLELDRGSDQLLSRIGDRIYLARDRGWRAMLEADGLARAAVAANKSVAQLLADEYAAMPAPTAEQLERLLGHEALANMDPAARLDGARSVWRLQQWVILRSVLVAEGLRGVPRERAQLMLVNPAFAGPETAIGKIGDRIVTRVELHLAAGYEEQSARLEYFEAARMLFSGEVRTRLLAQAAKEQTVSPEELVARELAKLGKPPKAEVVAFVAEHPEYAPHPERALDAVRTLREAAAKEALLTRLAAAVDGVRFVLQEPRFDAISPSVLLPRHAGNPDATDLIEVLHCVGGPTCEKGSSLARSIVELYGERARVELGDYFSGLDAVRLRHALALRCADEQGKSWALLERLLETPTRGGSDELVEGAAAVGVEPAGFRACLTEDRHLERVVENTLRAEQLGLEMNVVGIWVNGRRLDQLGDTRHVRATIDRALSE
ncbi:MAG TPA: thioredoxin domain-containing protein [Kofleriaceae bacterium]|nr:thioredoxin domain-containing protein [Kofleriaceae bacterium]